MTLYFSHIMHFKHALTAVEQLKHVYSALTVSPYFARLSHRSYCLCLKLLPRFKFRSTLLFFLFNFKILLQLLYSQRFRIVPNLLLFSGPRKCDNRSLMNETCVQRNGSFFFFQLRTNQKISDHYI